MEDLKVIIADERSKIAEAQKAVLSAIAGNEGEEEAQKGFNETLVSALGNIEAACSSIIESQKTQLEDLSSTHDTMVEDLKSQIEAKEQENKNLSEQVSSKIDELNEANASIELKDKEISELSEANRKLSKATEVQPKEVDDPKLELSGKTGREAYEERKQNLQR